MARYINSQKSSKIGGTVVNRATGVQKMTTNEVTNSQIDSSIRGDVVNTFGDPNARSSLEGSGYAIGLLRNIWKAIPGVNSALQICDKLFHLFRH